MRPIRSGLAGLIGGAGPSMDVMEPPFLERYGYPWIQHPDGLYYGPRWPGTDASLMDLEDVGLLGHTSMRRGSIGISCATLREHHRLAAGDGAGARAACPSLASRQVRGVVMAVVRVGEAVPCPSYDPDNPARGRHAAEGRRTMPTVTMVSWKGEQFWLGKLLQHPDVMTQGETIEELEENLRDAYRLMVLADVPDDARIKELEI